MTDYSVGPSHELIIVLCTRKLALQSHEKSLYPVRKCGCFFHRCFRVFLFSYSILFDIRAFKNITFRWFFWTRNNAMQLKATCQNTLMVFAAPLWVSSNIFSINQRIPMIEKHKRRPVLGAKPKNSLLRRWKVDSDLITKLYCFVMFLKLINFEIYLCDLGCLIVNQTIRAVRLKEDIDGTKITCIPPALTINAKQYRVDIIKKILKVEHLKIIISLQFLFMTTKLWPELV